MKKLVVANWKMHDSPEEALWLARAIKRKVGKSGAEVVVCAPSPLTSLLSPIFAGSSVKVGAQDVSVYESGAHTGEVPARLLKASGVTYVIVGHSERRAMGESDEAIAEKMARVSDVKLIPILCVGEETRDGGGNHFGVIERQLRAGLAKVGKKAPPFVVAYEPVWAIGKKADDAMNHMELQETVIFIRKIIVSLFGRSPGLAAPVLYGGSVEETNVGSLMKEGGMQGFLVGHASLNLKAFVA